VATRDVFSAGELARLRGFPESTRAELIRYFTLTGPDVAFLRKFHGTGNVLGAGVQLCSLPWLGFVPDDVTVVPAAAVARLAERLDIPAGDLAGYGQRGQTRTEHLREVLAYTGWRTVDRPGWKELDEFLFARAMEHDSPKLLFRLACEYLASQRMVRPGVILLLEHVASARERARAETWMLLAHLVSEDQGEGALRRRELDRLLVADVELGRTPLRWLETGPTTSSPAAVHTELAKLAYLGVGPEYARNGPRVVAASVVRCGQVPYRPTDLSMFNSRSVLTRALLIASRVVRSWLVWAASVLTSPVATASWLAAITSSRTCRASAACAAASGIGPTWRFWAICRSGVAERSTCQRISSSRAATSSGPAPAERRCSSPGGVSGLLVQGNRVGEHRLGLHHP
jgi:hypothetical protein